MYRSLLLSSALLASGCGQDQVASSGGSDLAVRGAVLDLGRSMADLAAPSSDLASSLDFAAPPTDAGESFDLAKPTSLIASRPYASHVPAGYDPMKPAPLVVMLHGYASDGPGHEGYFKLIPLSDAKGFLYAYPNGTKDGIGNRFWNATDGCCDLFKAKPDDVAYLNAVIDDMSMKYSVDPKRIFLIGHSNGGFMSHRMSCDVAPRIAAIVSLAGDDWKDVTKCNPTEPVAVLQIHGDKDGTINYNGGIQPLLQAYPSAHDSVGGWVAKNGCNAMADTTAAPVDVDSAINGNETTRERYLNCKGGAAELWTVKGGPHQPPLAMGFQSMIWDFLSSHPKP